MNKLYCTNFAGYSAYAADQHTYVADKHTYHADLKHC